MTRQTTITTLLAVVAVLLGANLLRASASERARTQPEFDHVAPGPLGATRVIRIALVSNDGLYRLWSDGTIERSTHDATDLCSGGVWCEWEEVPDDVPPQPNARITQIEAHASNWLYRLWSNGVVERNRIISSLHYCPDPEPVEWCGWQVVAE